nr:MAG TPA: hypothetical protein [Caudoviricetes sp.]
MFERYRTSHTLPIREAHTHYCYFIVKLHSYFYF